MLKTIVRNLGEPRGSIEALHREIAALEERAASLERSMRENQEQHEIATTKRRELLAAAEADFIDSPALTALNNEIHRTETRMTDLADATTAVRQLQATAAARLADEQDRKARSIESARVDRMLETAIKTRKQLDRALTDFIAAYQPLTTSGDMAATSANAFRESVATFASDAIVATQEYRQRIVDGTLALPEAVLALQKGASQANPRKVL